MSTNLGSSDVQNYLQQGQTLVNDAGNVNTDLSNANNIVNKYTPPASGGSNGGGAAVANYNKEYLAVTDLLDNLFYSIFGYHMSDDDMRTWAVKDVSLCKYAFNPDRTSNWTYNDYVKAWVQSQTFIDYLAGVGGAVLQNQARSFMNSHGTDVAQMVASSPNKPSGPANLSKQPDAGWLARQTRSTAIPGAVLTPGAVTAVGAASGTNWILYIGIAVGGFLLLKMMKIL